jgi:hypothetical protein
MSRSFAKPKCLRLSFEFQTMKKLYLHLGFHKTATSSFQETCKKNAEELSRQGYLYPIFVNIENQYMVANHSIAISSLFREAPELYHMNLTWRIQDVKRVNKGYLSQLKKFLNDDRDLIISGEGISNLSERELKNLFSEISNSGRRIIPIACVRSPYEFNCSALQERIKHGNFVDLSNWKTQIPKIENLEKFFDCGIKYIPFKPSCKHPKGPVGYLLNYIGIDDSNIELVNCNEGATNLWVRMQNLLNEAQPKIIDNKLNDDWEKLDFNVGEEKFALTEEEFKQIEKACEQENLYFADKFGEEFCDKKYNLSLPIENLKEKIKHVERCNERVHKIHKRRLKSQEKVYLTLVFIFAVAYYFINY